MSFTPAESYIADRIHDVAVMESALSFRSGTARAFQTLPPHLRRRAASHNPHRLHPRARAEGARDVAKCGTVPPKKLHRETRRTPAQLRRPACRLRPCPACQARAAALTSPPAPASAPTECTCSLHLETHLWLVKRFHMGHRGRWVVPEVSTQRGLRAAAAWARQECLVTDESFYSTYRLDGDDVRGYVTSICPGFGGWLAGKALLTTVNGAPVAPVDLAFISPTSCYLSAPPEVEDEVAAVLAAAPATVEVVHTAAQRLRFMGPRTHEILARTFVTDQPITTQTFVPTVIHTRDPRAARPARAAPPPAAGATTGRTTAARLPDIMHQGHARRIHAAGEPDAAAALATTVSAPAPVPAPLSGDDIADLTPAPAPAAAWPCATPDFGVLPVHPLCGGCAEPVYNKLLSGPLPPQAEVDTGAPAVPLTIMVVNLRAHAPAPYAGPSTTLLYAPAGTACPLLTTLVARGARAVGAADVTALDTDAGVAPFPAAYPDTLAGARHAARAAGAGLDLVAATPPGKRREMQGAPWPESAGGLANACRRYAELIVERDAARTARRQSSRAVARTWLAERAETPAEVGRDVQVIENELQNVRSQVYSSCTPLSPLLRGSEAREGVGLRTVLLVATAGVPKPVDKIRAQKATGYVVSGGISMKRGCGWAVAIVEGVIDAEVEFGSGRGRARIAGIAGL